MVKIDGTNIYLTRGDDLILSVDIFNPDETPYVVQPTDQFAFNLKKTADLWSEPLITLTNTGDCSFQFTPATTKYLSFGTYKYDILINNANGVDTFISGEFEIGEEVHT